MNYYLKASDEAELISTLTAAGIFIESDEGRILAQDVNLDVIGEIPDVIGYHANMIATLSEDQVLAIQPLVIDAPVNPFRVWA